MVRAQLRLLWAPQEPTLHLPAPLTRRPPALPLPHEQCKSFALGSLRLQLCIVYSFMFYALSLRSQDLVSARLSHTVPLFFGWCLTYLASPFCSEQVQLLCGFVPDPGTAFSLQGDTSDFSEARGGHVLSRSYLHNLAFAQIPLSSEKIGTECLKHLVHDA